MRTSEWIQIGFAVILAAAAWMRPLPVRRRFNTALLAMIAIVAISAARSSVYFLPPPYVSVIRDWLTAALMLVPYWQTGQFFLEPNEKIQAKLAAFDHRWMPRIAAASGTPRSQHRTVAGNRLSFLLSACASRPRGALCCGTARLCQHLLVHHPGIDIHLLRHYAIRSGAISSQYRQ